MWVNVNIVPAEPRTNAGKTNDQYLCGVSANTRRIVAMMMRTWPARMIHFELKILDSGPVKLTAKARTPIGMLDSQLEGVIKRG